jgi:hypothetical protein
VEFFGPGLKNLTVPDRATIANMTPEYGATMGFFPVDEKTIDYLRMTNRGRAAPTWKPTPRPPGSFTPVRKRRNTPRCWSWTWTPSPSLAGPARPQDRIALADHERRFCQHPGLRIRPRCRSGPSPSFTTNRADAPPAPGSTASPAKKRLRHGASTAGRPASATAARGDRGHHLLHQHLQPPRAHGRRPAGQKGRGARA